jgi:hypothetical protein
LGAVAPLSTHLFLVAVPLVFAVLAVAVYAAKARRGS